MSPLAIHRMLRWFASAFRVQRACQDIGKPVLILPERRVAKWQPWSVN